MPLRFRLESTPQTIQRMELAADARYEEAMTLLRLGYHGAAIYLTGYSAEMLLKCSCFLWGGARPSDRVSGWYGPAIHLGGRIIPGIGAEKGHSIRFWASLLSTRRRLDGRPLPEELDRTLDLKSYHLYENWWISMRYLPDAPTQAEALAVFDDVSWIRSNYFDLWR